jgi:branched-chain amino acid transport system ATP-binding protein
VSGLTVTGLSVERAGSSIVRGVDLTVAAGNVTVLLGANGAGKTTLLEALSGVIPAQAGSISLDGREITKLPRSTRARLGLAHVEQGRSIFPDLTVEENFLVCGPRSSIATGFDLFPELANRRHAKAGLLSGGEQQMLVISRALITKPRVLMLDEMSLGLAPTIIKRLTPVVRQLADEGVGVLLVEQFAALALSIGDRAYVLVGGRIAYDGDPQTLIDDPELLQALYLGVRDTAATS